MAQVPGDAPAAQSPPGINGDAGSLVVERALGELRRGRAIAIDHGTATVVVRSAETLTIEGLDSLAALSRDTLTLAVSAQRARTLSLSGDSDQAMAVRLPPSANLEHVHALSGLGQETPANPGPAVPCDAALAAAVKLCIQARLLPAVIAVQAPGLMDSSVLRVPAEETVRVRAQRGRHLESVARARVPLREEEDCELVLFRDARADREHLAVLVGRVDGEAVVPVRVHSACLTGDVLASLRCDCGDQLRGAVQRMSERGGGVLLYLDQEGRGIGLANKLRAYALQDTGLDTFDADECLGFGADERSFAEAAVMLRELGVSRIQLLTNNPQKLEELGREGIEIVAREPISGQRNRFNDRYLDAKVNRAGHMADDD
jgi:GTP cyclohydrolase II